MKKENYRHPSRILVDSVDGTTRLHGMHGARDATREGERSVLFPTNSDSPVPLSNDRSGLLAESTNFHRFAPPMAWFSERRLRNTRSIINPGPRSQRRFHSPAIDALDS